MNNITKIYDIYEIKLQAIKSLTSGISEIVDKKLIDYRVSMLVDCVSLKYYGESKSMKNVKISFLSYLKIILKILDIQKSKLSLVAALFDNLDEKGLITIHMPIKKSLSKKLNLSLQTVTRSMYDFVKKGLMTRLSAGQYEFNRKIFGTGSYQDILKHVQYNVQLTIQENGKLLVTTSLANLTL